MTQQFLRLVRKVMHCPWALAKKAWDTRDACTDPHGRSQKQAQLSCSDYIIMLYIQTVNCLIRRTEHAELQKEHPLTYRLQIRNVIYHLTEESTTTNKGN